jgi:hypothetical protein
MSSLIGLLSQQQLSRLWTAFIRSLGMDSLHTGISVIIGSIYFTNCFLVERFSHP